MAGTPPPRHLGKIKRCAAQADYQFLPAAHFTANKTTRPIYTLHPNLIFLVQHSISLDVPSALAKKS